MIEYAKQILPKVCAWEKLFQKELKKSLKWAGPGESDEIYNLCCRNYSDSHPDVLQEVFPTGWKNPK